MAIVNERHDRVCEEERTQRQMRIDDRDLADPLRNLWRRTVPHAYRERMYSALTQTRVELSDFEIEDLYDMCGELRRHRDALSLTGIAPTVGASPRTTLLAVWSTLDSQAITSLPERLTKTYRWWDYRLAVLTRGQPGAVHPPAATRSRSPGWVRQLARTAIPGPVRRSVMGHVLMVSHPSQVNLPA